MQAVHMMNTAGRGENPYTMIQSMTFGGRARDLILKLLSRWAAMAAHSDEVFRLGL
jgi:hypothetical protein